MAVYGSVTEAVGDLERGIESSQKPVLTGIALQFAKDANSMYVPFLTGALRGSVLATPLAMLQEGQVRWKTPYAVRRYFENHLHPDLTEWDVKTWDRNMKTYEKMGAQGFDTELRQYMR